MIDRNDDPRAKKMTVGNHAMIRRMGAWAAPLLLFGLSVLCVRMTASGWVSTSAGGTAPSGTIRLLASASRHPSLAFGFRAAVSDAVWLKAVQVAAPFRMTEPEFLHLGLLLDTVVHFDPRFKVPYLLGGISLGESPNHAGEALKLLDLGHRQYPKDWQMLFYAGYIRYFTLGDPVGGGTMLQEAAGLPDSPPYFPFLASRMLAEGREPRTALSFLTAMLAQETDPARRARLERRIGEVAVERDLQMLEVAIGQYHTRTGRNPRVPGDLVAAGILRKVPAEPFGGRYRIAPDGSVASTTMKERLKVFRK
jgi:hypothetical protein